MSHNFGLLIESLVAGLLVVTIGYCMLLNKRLRRLKADEMSLKAAISELIAATEVAERAVGGLKIAVRECDQDLGERLRMAERFSADIARQLADGEDILHRLTKIVAATRSAREQTAAPPDARDMLAAAQAFAERTRSRINGVAA